MTLWIAESYDGGSSQVLGVFSTRAAADRRAYQYLDTCTGYGHSYTRVHSIELDQSAQTQEEQDQARSKQSFLALC